jgi:enoyl-CoA hydratase
MAKWFNPDGVVTLSVAERVATITLNRPEKRNALSPELLRDLHGALMEADDLLEVNVIVLEGAGKDFCAGYDIVGVYAQREAEKNEAASYRQTIRAFDDDVWSLERNQDLANTLFKIHKPVIAKVHGNCLAGGVDIALHCDIVIAAEDARIGFPATRANGSPPNHMWIYHVGPQWAKRLLLTGDSLTGRDAAKIGLVLEAVPREELDAAVAELARRMSFVDADLLSAQKRIVNLAMELQGAMTLQRLAAENDARGHLSQGPRRAQFKADVAELGMKQAVKNRDAPFGDGMVRVRDY